jgi:hypothetical protein
MAIRTDHRTVNRRALAVGAGVIALAGGLVWLVLAVLRPAPQATATAIDLRSWKLTLPVAGEDGDAEEVEPAAVTEPWLTAGPDGSLTFWAPAAGATTKNAKSPRTELISLEEFSAGEERRSLTASLAVSQVPSDSEEIILGQIHGAGEIKSVPYVMLRYTAGSLEVEVKKEQKGDAKQTFPLLSGVPLGERFDVALTDNGDGSMTFTASHGGTTREATAEVPDAFRGEPVRFQVGDYQQAESATGADDGGRVTFSSIAQN